MVKSNPPDKKFLNDSRKLYRITLSFNYPSIVRYR